MQDNLSDEAARAAMSTTTYRAIDPWYASTGLRTNALRHDNTGVGSTTGAGEDFLIASRLTRNDLDTYLSVENYFSDSTVAMLSLAGEEATPPLGSIALPTPPALDLSFEQVLAKRRSRRLYTGDPLELDALSALLKSAAGVTGTSDVTLLKGGEVRLAFRTVPSGGGLYPVDLYAAAIRVRGVERGIYKFVPKKDELARVADEAALTQLLAGFSVSDDLISLSRACAVLLLVGRPWLSMRKYGPRGIRLMLLEAGAAAQHVNLAATALGIGSVDCSAFFDDELHDALGVDGIFQTIVHTVVVGVPGA